MSPSSSCSASVAFNSTKFQGKFERCELVGSSRAIEYSDDVLTVRTRTVDREDCSLLTAADLNYHHFTIRIIQTYILRSSLTLL